MKCATLHFVSTQTNRLGNFTLNSRNVFLAYKPYVVFQPRNKPKNSQHISFNVIFTMRKHLFYASSISFVIDKRYRINLKSVRNLENGQRRRDRLHIIAQILEISKSGCLKTQIMYRANLSFAQLNEYLSFLTKVNLLTPKTEDNKTLYVTSSKGNQYLEKYEDIANLLEENRQQ